MKDIKTKLAFLIGFLLGTALMIAAATTLVYSQDSEKVETAHDTTVKQLLDSMNGAEEIPSPCDRISEDQIFVFKERIIIEMPDAEWARFTDTNSMDPVIDEGANAIEYVPKSSQEICVGDIVSYESRYADGVLIHRVAELGYDDNGWYAVMKGDNNPYKDPGKIRWSQIKRVVVAIIY